MSYTINKTDGTTLTTVADGTLDTATASVTLIGKNTENYGIVLNENYFRLLESHANTTQPPAPHSGQLWFDTTVGELTLNVYNGTEFKPLATAAVGTVQPGTPSAGDQWYDDTNKQLNVYNGATYDLVGPAYNTVEGLSGEVVDTITSGGGTPVDHIVTKYYSGGVVYAILSGDAQFTPDVSLGAGFSDIYPGLTMSTAAANIVGDASNALSLGGVLATKYLHEDKAGVIAVDAGLTIGVDSDLTLTVTGAGVCEIRNTTSNQPIDFYVNDGGTPTKVLWMGGGTTFRPQVVLANSGADIVNVDYLSANFDGAGIKVLYEGETNTNAYTDADALKVSNYDEMTTGASNLVTCTFGADTTYVVALTANISLVSSGGVAGRRVDYIYTADASARTVTLNASWHSFGEGSPITIPATKSLILSLTATGATEGDVYCAAVLEN